MLRPAGRLPDVTLYVYGGTPPLTEAAVAMLALYDTPTVALGMVNVLAIESGVPEPLTVMLPVPLHVFGGGGVTPPAE